MSRSDTPLPDPRTLAHAAASQAAGFGRVVVARAYDDWSGDHAGPHAFREAGIEPRLVIAGRGPSSLVALGLEAVEHCCSGRGAETLCVLTGDALVAELTVRLRARARVVVVGPDAELEQGISAGAHLFVTLDELLNPMERAALVDVPTERISHADSRSSGPLPSATFDADRFDWVRFVRLVSWLEERLPFVGVGYLIKKAMNRDNVGVTDNRDKQALFQAAQDRGLVEVYYKDNIEQSGDPVAACQLLRDNPEVIRILDGLAAAEDSA